MQLILYNAVPVAQWIARWTSNPEAVGSNPTGDVLNVILKYVDFILWFQGICISEVVENLTCN